ncbi:hypothetical protein CLV51_103230 [Chitinophaga niastensis]|uniref:Fasciclin domain-containing protein n=1 Tax=Chitinophaga niastensis TaxID=536980 RepID=A0A2P8HJ68_CHINA|nr:hypothetical protein [Chitinophaga niastensis]PSL46254.1 hypothetical protein CLV51_103230 [Chitinophaga niastensis]
MQKRNYYAGTLCLLLLMVGLVFTGCQKDGGYKEYTKGDTQTDANMYDYLKSRTGVFDSMVIVIDRLGLKRVMSNTQITVFGITNTSFVTALRNLNVLREKEGLGTLSLADLDQKNLDTLFCRYLIPGVYATDSLRQYPDGRGINSIKYAREMNLQLFTQAASGYDGGGPKYIIYSDTKASFYISKWVRANTMSMDTYARNGVLHVLSGDHEFGFNEFISRFNQ